MLAINNLVWRLPRRQFERAFDAFRRSLGEEPLFSRALNMGSPLPAEEFSPLPVGLRQVCACRPTTRCMERRGAVAVATDKHEDARTALARRSTPSRHPSALNLSFGCEPGDFRALFARLSCARVEAYYTRRNSSGDRPRVRGPGLEVTPYLGGERRDVSIENHGRSQVRETLSTSSAAVPIGAPAPTRLRRRAPLAAGATSNARGRRPRAIAAGHLVRWGGRVVLVHGTGAAGERSRAFARRGAGPACAGGGGEARGVTMRSSPTATDASAWVAFHAPTTLLALLIAAVRRRRTRPPPPRGARPRADLWLRCVPPSSSARAPGPAGGGTTCDPLLRDAISLDTTSPRRVHLAAAGARGALEESGFELAPPDVGSTYADAFSRCGPRREKGSRASRSTFSSPSSWHAYHLDALASLASRCSGARRVEPIRLCPLLRFDRSRRRALLRPACCTPKPRYYEAIGGVRVIDLERRPTSRAGPSRIPSLP